MIRRSANKVVVVGLLLCAFAPREIDAYAFVGKWQRKAEALEAKLDASSPSLVIPEIDRTINDVIALGEHRETPAMLGPLLVLRAVAAARLGDERGAVWDWSVAQTLDPGLTNADLSRFGAAGDLLSKYRLDAETLRTAQGAKLPEGVERPKLVDKLKIGTLPSPLRRICRLSATLVLTIDREGISRRPIVLATSGSKIFDFWAMDSYRTIRFEPARRAGEAIEVDYVLTVSFSQSSC